MSQMDFLVKIPGEVCGNKSGTLVFDEEAYPSDTNTILVVKSPIKCGTTKFEVISETKRLKRVWLLTLKPNNHQNHSYPVTVLEYQKSRM
ncbi:MAG TPA: hypothetical protein PLX95_03490 [bacterium]|nr:hypothetical protein [bacterium]